jgi:hypothetical protein
MKYVPERGRIGIFNRSYYEETLVVRVHREFLDKQTLPLVSRQGRLTEPVADARVWRRGLLFVPLTGTPQKPVTGESAIRGAAGVCR